MYTINMLSRADKVKGQGVGSAYLEQMQLLRECIPQFQVKVNKFFSRADLIHVHTVNPEFRLRIQGSRTPILGSVHFLPETLNGSIRLPGVARKVLDWYVINFYQHMHEIVTVNPIFVDKLVELGFDRKHVHFLPNHVSAKDFVPFSSEEKEKVRIKYGLTPDDFVVIGAGQVQPRKGVSNFIDVAKQMPEVKFIWAGGFSFGVITDGYDELKKIVTHPPHNVKFLGIVPRTQMAELYAMADVMFLPSYAELFPMTILEAASTETPVLLRDLDLYDAVLGHNYCKGEDIDSFAQEIVNLRDNEKKRRDAVALSQKIKDTYSAQKVAAQWERLYTSIIERESRG